MFEYFNMLQSYLNRPVRKDIFKITQELTKSAGYYRDYYTLKNGKKRIKTFYKNQFDSKLVAEFILFYKKLFIGKLMSHPELRDDQILIINNTFFQVVNHINLEKVVNSSVINKLVNISLSNRIGQSMFEKGSKARLDEYIKTGKSNIRLNKIVNTVSMPFSQFEENTNWEPYIDFSFDYILSDLQNVIVSNVDKMLIQTMLSKKVRFSKNKVDKYLNLSKCQCTKELKDQIVDSYNKIVSILCKYYDKYQYTPIKSVQYSFEV